MKKITEWLNKTLGQLPSVNIKGNTWIVYLAILFLFGVIVLYIGTWIWKMFFIGDATLADLKDIIVVMCSTPFIAAITTLKVGVVDEDGDGISDSDEKEGEQIENRS